MIINHNMSAINANRLLGNSQADIQKDLEKLASGQRINKGADDASGLAVSEKMRSQIRGLNQAGQNIQNGISFIQTTEGYLQETQDIVHRVRELAVQAANGIYTQSDRQNIQVEVSQLVDEVNRVASHAQFNTMNLLTGAFAREGGKGLQIQVGANVDQNKSIFIGTMSAAALGLESQTAQGRQSINLSAPDSANLAIATLDGAINKITKQRADLGAYQNRFEMAYKGIAVAGENLTASESRIRDVDMASQMVSYTKNQVLSQAGNAMLAQANVNTRSVTQLLG